MTYDVEDLVNQALDAIGYAYHIGDIYEGSPAARVALEVYGLTRDNLLQEGDWPFALREVQLAPSGVTPPAPWVYQYAYPSDCLRIRYVRPGPLVTPNRNNDPQPILFRPFNDNTVQIARRGILCDISPAVLIYNAQIIDPSTWDPGYTAALVAELAKKMAFMLPQSEDTAKAAIQMAQQAKTEGMEVDDLSAPREGMMTGGNQK